MKNVRNQVLGQVSHPVWDRVKREIYMPVWSVSNNVLVALKQDITSGS